MSNTSWNAANFLPREGGNKISTPSIYTNLTLTLAEADESSFNFKYELEDSSYQTMRIWFEVKKESAEKYVDAVNRKKGKLMTASEKEAAITKQIAANQMNKLNVMNSIAIAVGEASDLIKISATSYEDLMNKLFLYIKKFEGKGKVNLKVGMTADGEWTEVNVNKIGSIEKYVSGKEPNLFFTDYEVDNGINVRKPKAQGNTSFSTPAAVPSFGAQSANFTANPFAAPEFSKPANAPVGEMAPSDSGDDNLPF
jgi:hypothetical protein